MAEVIARPEYTPPRNYTLRLDPAYDGVCYTSGTLIVCQTKYVADNPKCLQGDATSGNAQAAACNNGAASQKWYVARSLYDWVSIVTANDACITANRGTNTVRTTTCYNNYSDQKWYPVAGHKLQNRASNKCISLGADGTALSLAACDDPSAVPITL